MAGASHEPRSVVAAVVGALLALLAASLVIGLSSATAAEAQRGAHIPARAAIVHGDEAPEGAFPWLVFVEYHGVKGGFQCSGAIVAPFLVATAAHCATQEFESEVNPRGFRVRSGTTTPASQRGAVSKVIETIVNPHLEGTHGDVALLVLEREAVGAVLPVDPNPPVIAQAARLAGWGLTSAAEPEEPATLRWTPFEVLPESACQSAFGEADARRELCARGLNGASSGCNGDSGAPLIVETAAEQYAEAGVLDSGSTSCQVGTPENFARVDGRSGVFGWIASAARDVGTGIAPRIDGERGTPRGEYRSVPGAMHQLRAKLGRRGRVTEVEVTAYLKCAHEQGRWGGINFSNERIAFRDHVARMRGYLWRWNGWRKLYADVTLRERYEGWIEVTASLRARAFSRYLGFCSAPAIRSLLYRARR